MLECRNVWRHWNCMWFIYVLIRRKLMNPRELGVICEAAEMLGRKSWAYRWPPNDRSRRLRATDSPSFRRVAVRQVKGWHMSHAWWTRRRAITVIVSRMLIFFIRMRWCSHLWWWCRKSAHFLLSAYASLWCFMRLISKLRKGVAIRVLSWSQLIWPHVILKTSKKSASPKWEQETTKTAQSIQSAPCDLHSAYLNRWSVVEHLKISLA